MTKLFRSMAILCLSLGMLLLAGTSRAQTRPPIVDQLAKTYGLDSYGQLDAVRYTFNLELPALKVSLSRTWTWELNGAPANVKDEIDPGFNNDNYWFVFPFHVYWDTSAVVTVKDKQKLPIGQGTATLVSVKYPEEVGGYTPGDTWDLYVGKDGRIVQFVYHRGGPKKPSNVTTTWAGYKKAGPLLVSTEHRGTADGAAAHIFFSNVAFKLAGSDKWMDAQ
jgi:hypothetical protein